MHEKFAVVFREGSTEAAGALEVEEDRLLLRGRGSADELELEIPFSDVCEVRVGRTRSERLNGYRTLVLERAGKPDVSVAPLRLMLMPELSDLLISVSERTDGDVLAISVPLKPGCLDRARRLLDEGPPVAPASLGLSSHDVYLDRDRAIFVFRGTGVRARVSKAFHRPAVWRLGLAWQRCFAASPELVDASEIPQDTEPSYHWAAPD